jgi:carbonic anhydrase/acetyltransferase-like protein (isoleucine patch superfamily)
MPVRSEDGKTPRLAADVFVAPNAEVIGDVEMAEHSGLWFSSVIRANGAPVWIGVGTDIQDNSFVDSLPGQPCRLGSHTALGHGATVHASSVGDHVLIAMNATVMPGCTIAMNAPVMPGCTIGEGSIVAANATVPPGTVVPPGSLVIGDEGRVLREVRPSESERIAGTAGRYVELAAEYVAGIGRGW